MAKVGHSVRILPGLSVILFFPEALAEFGMKRGMTRFIGFLFFSGPLQSSVKKILPFNLVGPKDGKKLAKFVNVRVGHIL